MAELQREQEQAAHALQQAVDQGAGVRIENGKVIATRPERLWLPPEVAWLDDQIEQRIPLIELVDPLIELDRWTGFCEHFVHAGGARRRLPDLLPRLFAALCGYATNLGLHGIAARSSFSYAQLAQVVDWYLTEEALRAAIADIVEYQHQLELAADWGNGTFSMSDAQRLQAGASDPLAAALAREFGYRRGGVALLSWISDQYAIYGSKIVTLAGRESTYTLDEIVHNPLLEIERHTTDTYGSTDMLFALFDLLGKSFIPRIRDLQSHVDYRLGPGQPELEVDRTLLRKRSARTEIIIERWDAMQRAAASLKRGWVTPSLLISRLQAQPQQNPLAEALIEYGRILRTNHGLRWRADEAMRREVGAMLNKGEKVNDLRDHVRFGRQGQTRTSAREQHELTALCLQLVMNAINCWNTRYTTAIIERLERQGIPSATSPAPTSPPCASSTSTSTAATDSPNAGPLTAGSDAYDPPTSHARAPARPQTQHQAATEPTATNANRCPTRERDRALGGANALQTRENERDASHETAPSAPARADGDKHKPLPHARLPSEVPPGCVSVYLPATCVAGGQPSR